MHTPLPSEDTSTPTDDESLIERARSLTDAVPARSIRVLPEGSFVYVMQIASRGSNLSAILFLAHGTQFNEKEFAAHVREACQICDDVRLLTRRERMVKDKVRLKIEMVPKLNEDWFKTDADFVAAVMCDKFKYQIQKTINAVDAIDRTIKN